MNLMKSYNERQRKERVNQELDRMLEVENISKQNKQKEKENDL